MTASRPVGFPARTRRPVPPPAVAVLALCLMAVCPGAGALAQAAADPAPAAQDQPRPRNPLLPPEEGPRPTLAPEPEPPKPAAVAPEEEIVIIAPRRAMPDMMLVDEYHRAEYERLRAEFEEPPPPPPRAEESFDSPAAQDPNDRSDFRESLRQAPRLRDTLRRKPGQ